MSMPNVVLQSDTHITVTLQSHQGLSMQLLARTTLTTQGSLELRLDVFGHAVKAVCIAVLVLALGMFIIQALKCTCLPCTFHWVLQSSVLYARKTICTRVRIYIAAFNSCLCHNIGTYMAQKTS